MGSTPSPSALQTAPRCLTQTILLSPLFSTDRLNGRQDCRLASCNPVTSPASEISKHESLEKISFTKSPLFSSQSKHRKSSSQKSKIINSRVDEARPLIDERA